MHRLHQLRRTLPKNLAHNARDKRAVEFVLADLGPTPGLLGWAKTHCAKALASGYLKIFQAPAEGFHASVAKNTAHVHASGRILVNLDGDVMVGPRGGMKIINAMRRRRGKAVLHLTKGAGTYGCIAYPRKYFMGIRGYDQAFGPVGCQDTDVIVRMIAKYKLGYVGRRRVPKNTKRLLAYLRRMRHFQGVVVDSRLPGISALVNSKRDTVRHTRVRNWKKANQANHRILQRNLKRKRFVVNRRQRLGHGGVKRVN